MHALSYRSEADPAFQSATPTPGTHRYDCGLTLVHQELPAASAVVADVWVRAGAAAEPEDCGGIAHFLEHMLFKGSDRLPPGAFDWAIESCGGMANAATSHDYAHFYLTVGAEYLPQTLPFLAELLLRPALPVEEFERERGVVLEEIRACQDDPEWLGFQRLGELLYGDHAYGRSILGEPAGLQGQTPAQMRRFYQHCYQPQNMAVALVGAIDRATATALVGRAFAEFPAPPADALPAEASNVPQPLSGVRCDRLQVPHLEVGRLLMGWVGPGIADLATGYSLDLIATVLTEGRMARLVRELREERQLVFDISAAFSLQQDASLFTIAAVATPDVLPDVEAIVCQRLADLAAVPVSEVELARARRLLCQDYAFSTETPGQLAGLYGYYQTLARAELAVAYPQRIQQVRAADLMGAARRYLAPEGRAAVIVEPA